MTIFTYISLGLIAGIFNIFWILTIYDGIEWLDDHDIARKILKVLAIIVSFVFWPIPIIAMVLFIVYVIIINIVV